MPNYSNGKIYIIYNTTAPVFKVYYGSTVKKLNDRLSHHVCEFKHQCGHCESHRLIEMGNYKIKLIEEYPCNSKHELEDREAHYILTNWDSCVNKTVPGAVRRAGGMQQYLSQYNQEHREEKAVYNKQYRQEHRAEIAAYKTQYNQQNREKIAAQKGQIIECNLCGSLCSKNNIARHRQTKTCRAAVKSQVTNVLNDMINQIC